MGKNSNTSKKRKARLKAQRREESMRQRIQSDHAIDSDNNIRIRESSRVKLHNEVVRTIKSYDIYHCSLCDERNLLGDLLSNGECKKCSDYKRLKKKLPPWSSILCPIGDIPDVLKGLTTLERFMISLCHLDVFVVKLGFQGKKIQEGEICARGLRKNTIAFPMDLRTLDRAEKILSLPLSPASLIQSDRIRIIVYKGNDVLTRDEERKLQNMYREELTVRREVVRAALEWKRKNCALYQNVDINDELLSSLPDEEVYLQGKYEVAEDPQLDSFNDDDETLNSAFMDVPIEREANSNIWNRIGRALKYPVSSKPLSEFNWKEYFYKCFPVLFPLGREMDSFDKLEDCVRHLLLHRENRFREDCRFYFVAFSQLRRRKIIKSSKIQCGSVRYF